MTQLLSGYCTSSGTHQFQQNQENTGKVVQGHFRKTFEGLALSSLGMGSYLGNPDPETDADMESACQKSVESGAINIIDTAINYRYMASECSLGKTIVAMANAGTVPREQLFVCTKNGFLTPDAQINLDFRAYVKQELLDPGIIRPEDIAGGMHCMTPAYLSHQLDKSRSNLGLETIDLMYLHNASESQLGEVGLDEFMTRLKAAFAFYEEARTQNRIRYYGMATWNCFRVAPDDAADYLSLEIVMQLAESMGGPSHGFRFIQLPFNLAMHEALTLKNQSVGGQWMSTLQAAQALGIGVFASVPLLQGQLLAQQQLPPFEGLTTPAQKCLQFVRSAPGMLAPLVGHNKPAHVDDNLQVAKVPPLTPAQFEALFMQPPVNA